MIDVKNLKHSFTKNTPVFGDLSFAVKPHERILLSGRNGSGKTTLLKILAGQLRPTQGEVFINHLSPQSIEAKRLLVYISPTPEGLFPRLTLKENIHFFSKVLKMTPQGVEKHLEKWSHLQGFQLGLDTPFYQCSTGMKKMGMLAVLTLHSPHYLFADELFENIDKNSEEEIIKILNENFLECTMIITTHRKISSLLKYTKSWELIQGAIHAR